MHFFSVVLVCLGFVASGNFQKILENGMTCEDKRAALDQHNEYRMMIANGSVEGQPKASNMQKMVWDNVLEDMAQKWADNMKYQYNPNPKDDRFPVGENIVILSGKGANNDRRWRDVVKVWWDGNKDYTYGTTVEVQLYRQIVWANTNRLGCGYTFFVDNDKTYHKKFVCNYGPAGNVNRQYPYEIGKGCKKLCCTGNQCKHPYGNGC